MRQRHLYKYKFVISWRLQSTMLFITTCADNFNALGAEAFEGPYANSEKQDFKYNALNSIFKSMQKCNDSETSHLRDLRRPAYRTSNKLRSHTISYEAPQEIQPTKTHRLGFLSSSENGCPQTLCLPQSPSSSAH